MGLLPPSPIHGKVHPCFLFFINPFLKIDDIIDIKIKLISKSLYKIFIGINIMYAKYPSVNLNNGVSKLISIRKKEDDGLEKVKPSPPTSCQQLTINFKSPANQASVSACLSLADASLLRSYWCTLGCCFLISRQI